MKKIITILTLALVIACPLARAQNSIESDPAYLPIDKVLDFKAIPPQVNVNLPRFLLKDAISGLTNMPNKMPGGVDLADLTKDVKLIRVVVFEVPKTNRSVVEQGVTALRKELDTKWTSIANVHDGKDSTVGVYAMGDPSGESMAGVAVLVADGNNVVIVNIVGHVSIGKLMGLAAQMHKLPPELLQQLGVGGQTIRSTKNGNSAGSTNQTVESSDSKPKDGAKSEGSLK